MDQNIVIDVKDVSMRFNMANEKITSLKEYFIKTLRREIFYKEFWALKNINFKIYEGEVFGILGFNGAGKSTLLKIIAGVLKPTTGKVDVFGSMAPLIELGAGFDPELTARENIYLNGAVLGYNKKQMQTHFNEIVEFSELKEFMDVPIKNFSSGMYARLGFSIATIVKPNILIVDEILSVGDYKFQEKCQAKISNMIKEGTTVIMVSHSIEQLREMCDRGILIKNGELIFESNIDDVCNLFYNEND